MIQEVDYSKFILSSRAEGCQDSNKYQQHILDEEFRVDKHGKERVQAICGQLSAWTRAKVSQLLSITLEGLLKDRIFFLWFSNLEYFSVFFLPSFQKGIFAPRAPCLHNLSLIYFSFPKMLHKYKASRMRITVRKIVHLALLRASDVDGQNVTRQCTIWNNFRIDWILEGTSW